MESPGGILLMTVLDTLFNYFIKTFAAVSDSFQETGAILLTLYIVFMGYRFARGQVSETMQEFFAALIIVPICFGIFLNPGLFEEWVYYPIRDTIFSLMALVMGESTFTVKTLYGPVDGAFSQIFSAIDTVTNKAETGWNLGLKIKVFFVTGLLGLVFGALYALFTVLIIMAIFAFHVLIVLAPIFGVFAAIKPTRSYFFAWFKALITYALIPVFTAIVMGITLVFLKAAVTDISNIDVIEQGIFTMAIAGALLIGVMSITLHLKAPEFASAITGGQVSGVGGFFGTVASVGFGAAQISRHTGLTNMVSNSARGAGNQMGKMGRTGWEGVVNGYSKMRGFDK